MSTLQVGRNGGITGLLDLPGLSAKFEVKVMKWKPRLTGATRPRRGRGGGVWKTIRWIMSTGNITLVGDLPPNAVSPVPDAWKGQTGTLTIQPFVGKTIAYPVLVTDHGFDYDDSKQSYPSVTLGTEVTGLPTYTGWTPAAATDPSRSDQQQWEGTSFAVDASGLASAGQLVIDWWDGAVSDSNAAEITKLAAYIAGVSIPSPFKAKVPSIVRDATDGGTITIPLSLTTTAEDWINARTEETIDPNKETTHGTVAALNATPTLPTVSGQTIVLRTTTTNVINAANTGSTADYGQRNTLDDITYPGTHKDLDVSDLTSTGISTQTFDNGGSVPSAPDWSASGIQPVKHYEIRDNRDKWHAVDEYAKDTTKQTWEQDHSSESTDANQIASQAEAAAVDDSTPTAPVNTNLVKQYQRVLNITHDHTGYVDVYKLLDTTEEIKFPETHAKIDKSGLDSEGINTNVYDSGGSVPADASSPDASLQATATEITRINRIRSKKATYFGVNTAAEQWIYDHTRSNTDPSNIKNSKILGAVYVRGSEPSAPGSSGLVLNHIERFDLSSPNSSNKMGILWFYSETTSADDEIFSRSKTVTDPQNIKSETLYGAIFTNGSPPSDPSAPTGLKSVEHIDIPLTDASASNESIRIYHFAKLDSLDEIRLPKQKTTVDANHIADDAVRTKEWLSNASAPTTPSDAPSNNVKLIDYTDLVIYPAITNADTSVTPGLNLRVFAYGAKDSRDELILPNYETSTDQSTLVLESTAIRAYLDGDSVPSTPSGLVLVNAKAKPVTLSLGTNRTLTILYYGLATAQQKKETERFETAIDGGNNLDDRDVRSQLWLASGSAPSTPTVSNNAKLIGYVDVGVPENPLLLLRVWTFGAKTSADKLVLGDDRSSTDTDASSLESTAVRAYLDGSSPASTVTDGNGNTLVPIRTYVRPQTVGLSTNRIVTIVEFGQVTGQQKLEFGSSEASADPIDIYSYQTAAVALDTGTALKLLAAAQLTANQSNLNFASALVKRMTPDRVLNILKFTGEDFKIHRFSPSVTWRPLRGKPTGGYGNPASLVKVITQAAVGGVFYTEGYAQPLECLETTIRFSLRRRFITTDPTGKEFRGTFRAVNDATFLRNPAYTVMYEGPDEEYNENLGGSRLLIMDYQYVFKQMTLPDGTFISGHFSDALLPIDRVFYYYFGSGFSGTAFYDPRATIDPTANLLWHQVNDFSIFLAP